MPNTNTAVLTAKNYQAQLRACIENHLPPLGTRKAASTEQIGAAWLIFQHWLDENSIYADQLSEHQYALLILMELVPEDNEWLRAQVRQMAQHFKETINMATELERHRLLPEHFLQL